MSIIFFFFFFCASTIRIRKRLTGPVITTHRVWLTDLSTRFPSTVQLAGIDVSFNAAPPPEWLPANMTLQHWDIREPVPAELVGVYDIVHIRNFAFVLRDEEIPDVLDKLVQLAKPGGYVQWGEADVASFRIEKMNPENEVPALTKLLALSQGQDSRLKPTWVPGLAGLFETRGRLEAVEADVRDMPHHLALFNHECNLLVHELITRTTQNQEVKEGLEALMPLVAEETRKGAYWAFTRYTVIGRKPKEA